MYNIGIIGAMEVEVAQLKEMMRDVKVTKKAGMEFFEGFLGNKEVVLVRSGIGKVNAAICAQILADVYGVEIIMNTGIAGSLKAEINIGDIVISTDVLQHDVDATNFGYPLGEIPQMGRLSFPADEKLGNLCEEVCREALPQVGVWKGRIVSGDQFVADNETKKRIAQNFQGYCTEMEGAAIGQSAFLNEIPFIIIRAISDKADDSASMDYPTFEKQAIENGVTLLTEMLKRL